MIAERSLVRTPPGSAYTDPAVFVAEQERIFERTWTCVALAADLAGPGQILVSGTVYGTVLGAGLRFQDRGMQELRGVHGRWPIFALEG